MTKQEVNEIIAHGKFAIAEALEGKLITLLDGRKQRINGWTIDTIFGKFSLIQYDISTLEGYLRQQITE